MGMAAALAVLALRLVLIGLPLAPGGGGRLARAGRVVFAGTVANLLAVVALVSCRFCSNSLRWAS